MKKLRDFWSLHSYHLVAFWRNQIVMSILGISVGLATIALKNDTIAIVGCLFSVGLLCYLQYDNAFQLGLKDRYRPVDVKRPKRSLGLKLSLLGSAPLFLVCVLGLIFQISSLESPTVGIQLIYYAIHGSYIQTHALIKSAELFQTASLLGDVLNWALCWAYTIPVIVSMTLGYYLGACDKPLRTFLGIKYVPPKESNR